MSQKKLLAEFVRLLDAVFVGKYPHMNDRSAFMEDYQNLFKDEYDKMRNTVRGASDSKFLKQLMKAYIVACGKPGAHPNLVYYYKSDQLFVFLIEQSAKVEDDSLLNLWKPLIKGTGDNAGHSIRKRYLELDKHWQREIEVFLDKQWKKRRERRSLLDILRDAYQTQHGKKPTNAELVDFDPWPTARSLASNRISDVTYRWCEARSEGSDEKLKGFAEKLADVSTWFRTTGDKNLLQLFQAVKDLRLPTEIDLSEDREVLIHGLYAIACVQLYVTAHRKGLYKKNQFGFTKEEVEFFAGHMRRRGFRYSSNIINAIESRQHNADAKIDAISGMLQTFVAIKAWLPDLTLLSLAETIEIQKKLAGFRDMAERINLAATGNDPSKIEEIMTDPRNEEAMEAMREIASTRITLRQQQELSVRVLQAGASLGARDPLGKITVAYITPQGRVRIEFSAFKPQLFDAPDSWVVDRQYAQKISEIHDATIGIVQLTELMFMAMGFMPVLIQSGFAGLLFEIAATLATDKLEEKLEEIDPALAFLIATAIGIFGPRPNFRPKLKTDWDTAPPNGGLLAGKLNFTPRDRGLGRNGVTAESRALGDLGAAEVDALLAKFEIGDDVIKMNSGLPLSLSSLRDYMNALKPAAARVPTEWRTMVEQCKPLRDLVDAALRDPKGKVKLVRIGEKRGEALPFKYQRSTMGSDFELHITLDGQTYRFDGIIKGRGDTWYIGESKFTFKDMMEEADRSMSSVHAAGKANPATSYHFRFVEEATAQFARYSKIAKRFGFDGVAVMTNTEFIWQTFEQTTRRMQNVEIFLTRLSEHEDFAAWFGRPAADKAIDATGLHRR